MDLCDRIGSEGSVLFQGEGFGGNEQMGEGEEKRQGCRGVGECDIT